MWRTKPIDVLWELDASRAIWRHRSFSQWSLKVLHIKIPGGSESIFPIDHNVKARKSPEERLFPACHACRVLSKGRRPWWNHWTRVLKNVDSDRQPPLLHTIMKKMWLFLKDASQPCAHLLWFSNCCFASWENIFLSATVPMWAVGSTEAST